MTMRGAVLLLMLLIAFPADLRLAAAEDAAPATPSALELRLSKYDPRAVTAARHYFETPAIRVGLTAMTSNMTKAMANSILQQNPQLPVEKVEQLQKIIGAALAERMDLLTEMNMIAALDTFTPDELVALDNFYSSPVGASVIGKMPQMMAHLPDMVKAIMPDYLAAVKTAIKAQGLELKL
jgi:hypothetical protein